MVDRVQNNPQLSGVLLLIAPNAQNSTFDANHKFMMRPSFSETWTNVTELRLSTRIAQIWYCYLFSSSVSVFRFWLSLLVCRVVYDICILNNVANEFLVDMFARC